MPSEARQSPTGMEEAGAEVLNGGIRNNAAKMWVFRGQPRYPVRNFFQTKPGLRHLWDEALPFLARGPPALPMRSLWPSRRPLVHHLVVCSGTAPRYSLRCLNSLPLVPAQEKHGPPLVMEKYNLGADFSK